MKIRSFNRDRLLGWAAGISFLLGCINAGEYFLAGKNYLARYEGVVREVNYELTERRGLPFYMRTEIRLENLAKKFSLTDRAEDGGYVETRAGDTLTLYAAHALQYLYNYDWRGNLCYVERNGEQVYNNLDNWKTGAFRYLCIFGGCSLFLLVMYLDQVRNVSVANWWTRIRRRRAGRGDTRQPESPTDEN